MATVSVRFIVKSFESDEPGSVVLFVALKDTLSGVSVFLFVFGAVYDRPDTIRVEE